MYPPHHQPPNQPLGPGPQLQGQQAYPQPPYRWHRPRRFGFLIVLAITLWLVSLALAFFVGRESLRKEFRDTLAEGFGGSKENVEKPKDISNFKRFKTNPDEILKYFNESSIQAKDWSKDKIIEITWQVAYVGNAYVGKGDTFIDFEAKTGDSMNRNVSFWFDPKFRTQVGKLREGDTVTCAGILKETGMSGGLQFTGTELK